VTATTATTVAPATPTDGVGRRYRPATFVDVVRSEWTKLRTVRSTWWALLVTVLLGIGLGALITLAASNHYNNLGPSDKASWDPTKISTVGLAFGQLAIAVLGIMFIASEYSTGMIRTSLAAVPRRSRLLGAKALVFAVVALVVGEVLGVISFVIGQAIIKAEGAPTASLSSGAPLRAVLGIGLYLAVLAVIAVGFGAIVRSTAAAIAMIVALLFVLPAISEALPDSWQHPIQKYWPTDAGSQLLSVHRGAYTLSPWLGFLVMVVFAAVVMAVALYLMNLRDA
jgi:ABC-2 type transport system permease protein